MQVLITRDLYPTIGSQGAVVERKWMLPQHNVENQIRRDRDMGRNPILDAGGNRSTRGKPARSGMDRQPNSLTNSVAIPGIEPGPQWWEASVSTTTPARPPGSGWCRIQCHLHYVLSVTTKCRYLIILKKGFVFVFVFGFFFCFFFVFIKSYLEIRSIKMNHNYISYFLNAML